jgi:RNA-directed DNA polymerase
MYRSLVFTDSSLREAFAQTPLGTSEKNLVLNIDLENFFPSIHFGRVRGMFRKPPFNLPEPVAATLAQLCTDGGVLPQGASTSPMISNFICRRLDNDLFRLAKKQGCSYSRFADDMTFSTAHRVFAPEIVESFDVYGASVTLGPELLSVIYKHEFAVNASKSRVRSAHRRQEVTGLTVNRRVNVPRKYIRRVRAIIHNWKMSGYAAADAAFQSADGTRKTRMYGPPSISRHLGGKLEFLRMVRGRGDPLQAKYAIAASKLPGYDVPALLEGRAATIPSFIREALWVVLGRNAAGAFGPQGSAFPLSGSGFVSALHVFEPGEPGYDDWKIVRGCHPYDEFPITGYKHHPAFDLTLLQTLARPHAVLRETSDAVGNGDPVVVLGFPNWHTYGDQPLTVNTHVVQQKVVSGSYLSSVSYSLLSGASGGPVMDTRGTVAGVVVGSASSAVLPNSFISSKHLDDVIAAPWKAL